MGVHDDDPILPPALAATELIRSGDDPLVFTDVRETDARTAITRGLKEYLQTLKITYNGRESRFKKVLESWADPEDNAEWPSAIAYAPDTGTYDGDSFSTQVVSIADANGGKVVLRLLCELVQTVTVEVISTDPVERMALAAMLEDAFSPVDFMAGFRLRLPHYFGAFATYLPKSISYQDSSDDAQHRTRRVIVSLEATVAVIRFVGLVPKLQPRFKLEVGPGS